MSYYTVPEDITIAWAGLMDDAARQEARRHPWHVMEFVCLVNGKIPEAASMTYQGLEPKARNRSASSSNYTWWAVLRRMVSCVPDYRRYLMKMLVIVDSDGEPFAWTSPTAERLF